MWTPEMEVSLFYAMMDHKPVGENKHFHMIFIYEKFNSLCEKKLSVDQLWQHLSTMYDLGALVRKLFLC
jgi:MRG-binding protein